MRDRLPLYSRERDTAQTLPWVANSHRANPTKRMISRRDLSQRSIAEIYWLAAEVPMQLLFPFADNVSAKRQLLTVPS